jgi:hypothetical protein
MTNRLQRSVRRRTNAIENLKDCLSISLMGNGLARKVDSAISPDSKSYSGRSLGDSYTNLLTQPVPSLKTYRNYSAHSPHFSFALNFQPSAKRESPRLARA